eukprot:5098197-Amphidinium_carterae.1
MPAKPSAAALRGAQHPPATRGAIAAWYPGQCLPPKKSDRALQGSPATPSLMLDSPPEESESEHVVEEPPRGGKVSDLELEKEPDEEHELAWVAVPAPCHHSQKLEQA